MGKRQSLSKAIRFEVFKRDKFTCQYCGRASPDVILEVDHIRPVSRGGTNDIINLVTSCRDCNRGKRDKTLADDSTVRIQRKQLDELQTKREQMEMLVAWKDELLQEDEMMLQSINKLIMSKTYEPETGGLSLNKSSLNKVNELIREFGFEEVYESVKLSYDRYFDGSRESGIKAFYKIGGVCYNRRKQRRIDAEQDP